MKIRLWEVRSEKGVTERELAKLTGISKSTINNFENEKSIPNLIQLEAIARALDVGIVDLFDSEYKFKSCP